MIHIWVGLSDMRRAALSAWLGVPEHELRFAKGVHGKPYLPDWPGVHFNISHSGALFVCAISEAAEIGVDVERIREVPEKEHIAERYGLDANRFFETWTEREAYLKALGLGVFGLEDSVRPGVWVEAFDPGPGYAGAWAVVGERLPVAIRRWE
jgi:4'-phosphopantetheinyl transferase